MGGHAKCLLLMTRGEGGGSKIRKTCLRNTWMFPKTNRKNTVFWGNFVCLGLRVIPKLQIVVGNVA